MMTMPDNNQAEKAELFFPYYINQGRLLDIYAILNGGYSEYSEITTAINTERGKSKKGDASVSGSFKIFNFGMSGTYGVEDKEGNQKEHKEKKVQTLTSVLSLVKRALSEKGYIQEILEAKPGDFVCIPVELSINSIKSLLSELTELLELTKSMKTIGADINIANNDIKKYDTLLKAIQELFTGEEILFQTENYAVIGNILDANLYQANRADIIDSEMICLAQVKRVFPNGTELMKNTIFTKIKDKSSKEALVKAISGIANGNIFDFEAVAVPSIDDKPVYQLEIIALYQ